MALGAATLPETSQPRLQRKRVPLELSGVLLLTVLSFLVMGYHPGLEDDGIYLTAVKADLNPALYPYNADFFRLQLQATVFDRWMAAFVQGTRIPLAWAELFWQIFALFVILWAAKKIANRLFEADTARWGGVGLIAAMFTLPVSGTALYMADQHLHPRTLVTAAILLAINCILDGKRWPAALLLLVAFLLHPLMAIMGVSFCVFLAIARRDGSRSRVDSWQEPALAIAPLGWVFAPAAPGWKQALDTRAYLYLYKWTWYEWLGAIGPLVFFWAVWRWSKNHGNHTLARFSLAAFCYGVFHQALAMVLLWPASLIRLTSFQPMRYLHLLYFLFMLAAGGLIGQYLLKRSAWRWAAFFLAINGCMFAWQRAEFASSQHLELPGRPPANEWLQAFAWVKANTPLNAYFALDPHYLEEPGEDYHSFLALAERSQLADAVKDAAVVTLVPELGPRWVRQVQAQEGWSKFTPADFERLKREFGVDWVVVYSDKTAGLDCRWHSRTLAVCHIP
jgi:hypothetical protein